MPRNYVQIGTVRQRHVMSRICAEKTDVFLTTIQLSHLAPHFVRSDANAFLTSDWDMPNCRAIREGVTPALKAARTAFNLPCVNAISAILTCRRFSVGGTVSSSSQDERRTDCVKYVSLSLHSVASYLDASTLQLLPHASSPTRRRSNV